MKFLLAFFLTTSAFAAQLEVSEYDQMTLAHFLNKLPSEVARRNVESFSGGKKITVIFPKRSDVLRMKCESEFFDPAPVPSTSTCSIEIEINNQLIEKNYDEVRLKEENVETAEALFSIMTYGHDPKSFRSGVWEEGTDFNGRRTNIFTYLFECSRSSCLYRFSEKVIK
jgi:hypothetical protein